jgi:hypothetical protein
MGVLTGSDRFCRWTRAEKSRESVAKMQSQLDQIKEITGMKVCLFFFAFSGLDAL